MVPSRVEIGLWSVISTPASTKPCSSISNQADIRADKIFEVWGTSDGATPASHATHYSRLEEGEDEDEEKKKDVPLRLRHVFPPFVLDRLYESYPSRGFLVVKSRQSDLHTDRGCVLWFYERGSFQRDETPDRADGSLC